MKKWLSMLLTLTLAVCMLPAASLAVAQQMRDGVPEWTEETVKQYALDFVHGNDLERLYGYYDLQIRRYMPMDTYTGMLTEIEWMTGDFVALGTYTSFAEESLKTKTHVLHLCMEKQDLDLYFTHKDKADDWEVMAVEFVPAAKQTPPVTESSLDSQEDSAATTPYTQTDVTVGAEPTALPGTLTMPDTASEANPVAAVVLVQDSETGDRDATRGQTALFADLADTFARMGVATLRYDKRTYVYGDTLTAEETAALTAEETVIQDAIAAGTLLENNPAVDSKRIVLLGHGLGAMLAPRIASEANGLYAGMILLAGSPEPYADLLLERSQNALATLQGDALAQASADADTLKAEVQALKAAKTAEDASGLTVAGTNGLFYWEMMQTDPIKLMTKLKIPTYIVQGNADAQVPLELGIDAYEDALDGKADFVEYKLFRKLNHLLMSYTGPSENRGTEAEFDTPAKLDKQAGRDLADWVLALGQTEEEE